MTAHRHDSRFESKLESVLDDMYKHNRLCLVFVSPLYIRIRIYRKAILESLLSGVPSIDQPSLRVVEPKEVWAEIFGSSLRRKT